MDAFKDLLKKEKMGQVLLSIIFIIYLIMGYKTPEVVANLIDNTLGKLVVVIVALLLFSCCNPILGILGLIVAYELIRRSSLVRRGSADNYMVRSSPSEIQRAVEMEQMNPVRSVTLEEDVISKMAPAQVFHENTIDTGFKPVAERVVGASKFL